MRVALIYNDGLGRGGYPRDVRWLASGLASHGLHVTLFCRNSQDESRTTEGLKESVCVKRIGRLAREHADVYHVFRIFMPSQVPKILHLLLKDKPVVISPMGASDDFSPSA